MSCINFQGIRIYCAALNVASPPRSWNAPRRNLSPLPTLLSFRSLKSPNILVRPSMTAPTLNLTRLNANLPIANANLNALTNASGFFSMTSKTPNMIKYLATVPRIPPSACKKPLTGFLTFSAISFLSSFASSTPFSACSSESSLFSLWKSFLANFFILAPKVSFSLRSALTSAICS